MDYKINHFSRIDFTLLKRTQKIVPPTEQLVFSLYELVVTLASMPLKACVYYFLKIHYTSDVITFMRLQ